MPRREIRRIRRVGMSETGDMQYGVYSDAGSRQTGGVIQITEHLFHGGIPMPSRTPVFRPLTSDQHSHTGTPFAQRADQSTANEPGSTGHQHRPALEKVRRYHQRQPCRLKNIAAARRKRLT